METPGLRTVIGHVDGFEGNYVVGWAVPKNHDLSCTIEIFDASENLLTSGKAERARQDLSVLGLGRNTFAFRISLADAMASKHIRVFADGAELPGSPVPMGSLRFDGAMQVVEDVIHGWVTERVTTARCPVIQIYDQLNRMIGPVPSKFNSADDPLFRPARFSLRLPQHFYGVRELKLRAFADDIEFARATGRAALTGSLDHAWPDHCTGWLISPDVPSQHFDIEVFRNSQKVGEGSCMLPRPDLKGMFPFSWDVGFDIRFPVADAAVQASSELSVRLHNSAHDLFGGPFIVGRRPAIIALSHKVTVLSHTPAAGLSVPEQAVLGEALRQYTETTRRGDDYVLLRAGPRRESAGDARRLSVIIPVYRDVELTRQCIEAVMSNRSAVTDAVILVNDCSPDPDMKPMLLSFAGKKNVFVLENTENIGFIKSANRGISFAISGDVLLLNSDARMFHGCLDELWGVAHSDPGIGTVTALSNNATIFSYPHPDLRLTALDDVTWAELAAAALTANAGVHFEVPTAHGFCMLIKREVLDQVGCLNEAFGRGYCEENEFCLRASDLGYRHVAAVGAFVEHKESVSFGYEKNVLFKKNITELEKMFPEYTPTVMAYQERDGLRRARWALDQYRLRKASKQGGCFVVVVNNWLLGGTATAIRDMENFAGYGEARKISLRCDATGLMHVESDDPRFHAVFLADEVEELFRLLASATIRNVFVHQLLGFGALFIEQLGNFCAGRKSAYFAHDFYPICPRVTLINAVGEFCRVLDVAYCDRCIELAAEHEASRLGLRDIGAHRRIFARFLTRAGHVVAPSHDAAAWFRAAFPDVAVDVVPHPQTGVSFPAAPRAADLNRIALLGAIGPHKGSRALLDIARRARLLEPQLQFHVIGHTDIDQELLRLGNVTITGPYKPDELAGLIEASGVGAALFLHGWPETFSYTLTEAVSHGLLPIVPDIGAPAERVRAAGWGVVFPFPIDPPGVVRLLARLGRDGIDAGAAAGKLSGFASTASAEALRALLNVSPDAAAGEGMSHSLLKTA